MVHPIIASFTTSALIMNMSVVRLKKEREHRKKQEATSLEETKEQIADLERKLANLKVRSLKRLSNSSVFSGPSEEFLTYFIFSVSSYPGRFSSNGSLAL